MYALAIDFGDNDFYNTFVPLLDSLDFNFINDNTLTKVQLVDIINELSYGMYLANQHHYELGDTHLKGLKDYLRIQPERICVDQEVDVYFHAENQHKNGHFYYRYLNQKAGST